MKANQIQVGKVYYDRFGRRYNVHLISTRKSKKTVHFTRVGDFIENGNLPLRKFAALMEGAIPDATTGN